MTLNRKECVTLYEGSRCTGEVALFASTSRDAFEVAGRMCAGCPVADLCLQHVNPVEDGFTGTCAGKLYYDGRDVTDEPNALPPPVFRGTDVDLLGVDDIVSGENDLVKIVNGALKWHSESTVMTAFWVLRNNKKWTLNRIAKLYAFEKDLVVTFLYAFDDGASSDFKDFIASQISEA